jgi:hypothetical protein
VPVSFFCAHAARLMHAAMTTANLPFFFKRGTPTADG